MFPNVPREKGLRPLHPLFAEPVTFSSLVRARIPARAAYSGTIAGRMPRKPRVVVAGRPSTGGLHEETGYTWKAAVMRRITAILLTFALSAILLPQGSSAYFCACCRSHSSCHRTAGKHDCGEGQPAQGTHIESQHCRKCRCPGSLPESVAAAATPRRFGVVLRASLARHTHPQTVLIHASDAHSGRAPPLQASL
jgi:hypothetical protein